MRDVVALLHGESDAGSGTYNSFDRWSTTLRGQAGSSGARLVTVHEAVHVALNDTTAFGVLLAVAAVLARTQPSPHGSTLGRLVSQCRGVHEAFATFEGVWLAVDGDQSYLAGYPPYQRWYRDASELVPLPDHSRRKEMMLEAAARACMHPPILGRVAADLESPQVWDLRSKERPDDRFGLLHRYADASFWTRAWDECTAAVAGSPLLAALQASDREPALRQETYSDIYSEELATCARLLHVAVARLLAEHGAATLGYDDHRGHLTELIAAVETAAPGARGLLLASSDERSVQDESFEMWRRERLVLREQPRPAVLRQFRDVLRDRRIESLLSGDGDQMHVFVSARPAHRLAEQFVLPEEGSAWLRGRGANPTVTVRSTAGDPAPVVLTVVDTPSDLAAIIRGLPAPLTMHVNVSLACLGDITWRDQWSPAMSQGRLTGLIDLSPMAQVDTWREHHESLVYAQATVRDTDTDPAELLVWMVGDSNLPLLLICTAVTGGVLQQYIERTYPQARHDPQIIVGRQADIELATSHLVHEESFFDLSAYLDAPLGPGEATI